MSRLSIILRRYQATGLIRTLVAYLEKVDLPGAQKKALVLSILKLVHKQTGGKWDKQLESALSWAIEYVLAEVREAAREWNDDLPTFPAEPEEDEPLGKYNVVLRAEPDWTEYLNGDQVFSDSQSDPTMFFVVPAKTRPFLPVGIRIFHGVVQDGQLVKV